MSVCLSVCLSVCMSVCLSVGLSACRSVGPSVGRSVHLSISTLNATVCNAHRVQYDAARVGRPGSIEGTFSRWVRKKPVRVSRPLPDTNTLLTASDLTGNGELGLSVFMHFFSLHFLGMLFVGSTVRQERHWCLPRRLPKQEVSRGVLRYLL